MFEISRSRADEVIAIKLVMDVHCVVREYISFVLGRHSDRSVSHVFGRVAEMVVWCYSGLLMLAGCRGAGIRALTLHSGLWTACTVSISIYVKASKVQNLRFCKCSA
jgi:hypothetical protein